MNTDKYFEQYSIIPVVVKDKNTNKVLSVAFMNKEALEKTLETGTVWYCSRTSGKLWKKGEESAQKLVSIYSDCDNNSLLIKVYQTGYACHVGKSTCFYKRIWPEHEHRQRTSQSN